MRLTLALLAFVALPGLAMADRCSEFGADPLEGFAPLDAVTYLDLPDPDTFRAVAPIETELLNALYSSEVEGFTKRWCTVGIQDFVVEFEVPVMDDSIAARILRAVYVWDTSTDMVGWQINQLGERFRCARGDDPFAPLCP